MRLFESQKTSSAPRSSLGAPSPLRGEGNWLWTVSVFWLSLVVPAFAQEATPEQLGAVQQTIELTAARRAELEREVEVQLAAEKDASQKLVGLADGYEQAGAAVQRSEGALKNLREEEILIRSELAAKRDVLSRVLAGLQRLEQNPPPALVVAPDDVLGALRGAMMFGVVVPELKDEAVKLTRKLERLQAVRNETLAVQAKAAEQRSLFVVQKTELEALMQEKKRLAEASRAGVKEADERLAALANEAKSLKELLDGIEAEKLRAEKAMAAQQAAEEKARLAEEERIRARSRLSMADAKGKLDYPVQGQILRQFGEDNGFGTPLSGMVIDASPGALVRVPVEGKIQFAGPFRTLGQMVIVDAGQNYMILLAGLSQLNVVAGQSVAAGEPVGQMGQERAAVSFIDFGNDVAKRDAGKTAKNPILYVEIRNKGTPVDSKPWWAGSRKEAKR
jgi:murein hydrolase activator